MPLVTDLRPDEVPAFMSRGFRVENMSNCSIVSSMCVTCSGRVARVSAPRFRLPSAREQGSQQVAARAGEGQYYGPWAFGAGLWLGSG